MPDPEPGPGAALAFEPLDRHHHLLDFTCGQVELDQYLRQQAYFTDRLGYGRTTVAVLPGSREVVGYFSLCSTMIMPGDVPPADRKGLPRYPMPAVLLTKLAVHSGWGRQGLGRRLVLRALREALRVKRTAIGWRYFVIDVADERLTAFYGRFGFSVLNRMRSGLLRLAMRVETIEELLSDAAAPA